MSRFESYTPEQLEEHLSNYLLDSWSYSKVNSFSRNEKAFEREYIYCEVGRSSSSTVAGNAYHEALQYYFECFRDQKPEPSIIDLQQIAYIYITEFEPHRWKLQKRTPTVETAMEAAIADANFLIESFMREKSIYLDEIEEVLEVERSGTAWVTVNGQDIPLPLNYRLDVKARLRDGQIVIIDHKSKTQYSDEEEIALTYGKQGITYVIGEEALCPEHKVSVVWIVENKRTANRDRSPQLRKHVISMEPDQRRLYEALLYAPLKRMCKALNDPDYEYVINDNDTLVSKAEIYEFTMRTMISEVEDFDVPEDKKELVSQRLRKVKDSSLAMISPKVITSFKKNAASFIQYDFSMTDMTNKERIEHVLRSFGLVTNVAHEISGYSSDTYLLECSAGVRFTEVKKLHMNLANALNVSSVRIPQNLIMYEGKSFLGIEMSKKRTESRMWDGTLLDGTLIPLGRDNFRDLKVWDLDNQSTPHMLVCGSTGSGKSVLIISVVAFAKLMPQVERIIIFDPKYEFSDMADDKTEVYNEIEDIENRSEELVEDMQSRAKSKRKYNRYTMVIYEEFADAIDQARSGKELDIYEEVEEGFYANGTPKIKKVVVGRKKSLSENLKMLAQKGRSLGYRLIAATQRASAKIISGDIKVNFPVQVCFRMPKAKDSEVVLGQPGAEALAGKGDGLLRSPEYSDDLVRFQGFYKES